MTGRENMKKSDQNIFLRSIKSWQFLLLALLFAFSADAYALQQLTNTGFDTNLAGWTNPSPVNAPFAFSTNGRAAGGGSPGASFRMSYDRNNAVARRADCMIYQPFNTPAGPVNASLYFDYKRIRTNSPPSYYLSGDFCSNTGVVLFTPFDESFAATAYNNTTWYNTGWTAPVLLSAGTAYRLRVYCDVTCSSAGRLSGADIDNVQVNISPSSLTGDSDGTQNSFTWDVSNGAVGLHATTPYRVYWGSTSGSYTSSSVSTTNSFSHAAPAGAVVYYAVTDTGTDNNESPRSVEWAIVRVPVNDGSGADIDDFFRGSDITMNWSHVAVTGFTRTGYEVALGSTPGDNDIVAWSALPAAATTHTFSAPALTAGNTYYCSVRPVTDRGTLNFSSSDGFTCRALDVRDGSGADIDISSSLNAVDMNWDASPIAVSRYEVALGTTPGASNVVGWTNVNLSTSYSFTGLSLTNGATYYCSVRPMDASNNPMGILPSDGFSPAVAYSTTVRDGTGADIDVSLSANLIDLNWDNVVMTKVRYEAALGTTPGGTDIVNWTDMALATSGNLSGFTLVDGTTYYCSVRIVLGAGPLPADSSDGFTFVSMQVRDGLGADEDFSYLPDVVNANWDAVAVPLSRYEVAVGTTPGGTELVGWTNNGLSTSFTATGLSLVNGAFYYVSVRPVDAGGVSLGTVVSNGFQATLPTAVTVRDGLGPDILYSFLDDRAELNWDHPNVEIIRYEVAVGTSKYGTNVVAWTDVGQTNRASLTGLNLASGTMYYASVRGISAFGATAAVGSSDGFLARRDQVLVDTASQSFFHNARVLNMIDTTTDAGSIRPRVFSNPGGGTAYWRYRMPITITEPGVTSRINAPCRVFFTIPAGQMGSVNEIRVADEHGNEIPRYNLAVSTTNLDFVFLVNMAQSETKTYWVYWGNPTATDPGAAYGFTNTATGVSATQWTPYYSRKNTEPGAEEPVLGATLSNADDATVTPPALPWNFYFFGTNTTAWRMNTNGFLSITAVGSPVQYSNRWANFTGATFGRGIMPMWSDLWPGGGSPIPDGIFRNAYADRVVYTWRANRWGVRDDIYITQAVLYRTSDIALRYSYLSTLGIIGPTPNYDRPANTENTVGITNSDNTRWLINTPLVIGIGKSPTAFYQCADAFRGNFTPGAIIGGAVGTWNEVAHIESMVFDSRTANPIWQRIEYDCTGNANNRLVISTRSGNTALPELGGWTGWVPAATVTGSGNTALNSTDRYIQYRVGFERNNTVGALATLSEVRFIHGGISIEEIKANTPDGVSQGQTGIPVEVTIKNFYSGPVDLQSVELTFSLGNHTQVLTGPALPTSIAAGDTISVFFNVDVDVNSPVGTATVDARATATVALPALTFYDGDAQSPHKWWIRSKAQLVIDQVETEESFVNKGQTDLFVRMYVSNTGETPFTLTAADLTFTLGLYNPPTILQSPALGTVIPPLSSFIATFTVNIDPLSPSGVAIIGGTASGTNTFSGAVTEDLTATITDSWTIQNPSELVLEEVVASETVYRGQTNTPVFLRVSNGGEATARWQSSSIIPYLSLGLYDAEYPITPFEILILGGFEATARYGVDISPISPVGTSIVDASVSGRDYNTGFPIGWTNALIPTEWTILAEKINTFKDAAHSQNSISFNRPTAGSLTIYAKAENLNPYGEFVIRWLDPSNNIIAASPPLTADASGTLSHQIDITSTSAYGNYKIRVTNPINTIISCENQFEVVSPAVLTAAFSMPSQVSVGQPFTASFTFINSGGAAVSSAYVSNPLQFFGPGTALQTSGPPSLTDVSGNSQATVTYNFTAQSAGNFSASGTAYGFDANSGLFLTSPAVTSNICLIQTPPNLSVLSVNATPNTVYLNQKNLQVQVVVRNTGQATAILDAASLTFQVGNYTQTLVSPAFPFELAGGGTNVTITFNVDVSAVPPSGAGPWADTFFANVKWSDKNWPENQGWLTGSPPSDSWTINPIGIMLSSNITYSPQQADFNRLQTVYIRVYNVSPLSQWYRVRVYNYQVAQAVNSPAAPVWRNVSPQLSADADGYVDHLYTVQAADVIGTWSVVIEADPDSNGNTVGAMLGLQYFRVQNPGNLVASLSISPTSVFVGENFTVTMIATNTVAEASTISNATPSTLIDASAFPNFGGSATLLSGPTPASITVKSLNSGTISYTYRADSDTGLTASYALTVTPAWYISGNDLNTGAGVFSGKGVSNPLTIYSRRIQMSPDSLSFGTLNCGETAKVDGTVLNIGNYQLDHIKWITTDMNGPGALKISKSNLSMSPNPVNQLAGGGSKAASATLFVPYNKEAGTYIATMSVYNDRNLNDMADIDEAYDLFNVSVTVPPCKKIFTVQEFLDLGAWPVGQTSPGKSLNFFSGGNIGLDNVKLMQLPGAANGTNTFVISATPSNPGPMAITGVGVASISAVNVAVPGIYIATWTIWDDSANPGVVDAGEASDTFQVRVQVGVMNYTLNPLTVDAGTVEPSGLNLGFGLTLTNDVAGLPLTRLRLDNLPLSDGGGNTIASDNIAIYTVNNPIPPTVTAGQAIPVDLALFVPAGTPAGTYSATQYIYHDDNGNNKWDAAEFRASFVLQATIPAVPKVQVMAATIGLGGIAPDTSKIVSFNCRNTGNVTLTGLRWEKVNLMSGANVIAAANASFPPSELFSVPPGAFFTRQVELYVPAGTPYGLYESIPNHFWIWADMPVNSVRDPGEASWSFKISCEVGDLLVDIDEPNLSVAGPPNATTPSTTLSARNTGSLALVNIKATGTALILTPPVAGAVDVAATANNFSPVSLGGANSGQVRTSQWSVTVPANASAGVYLGTVTVWEDSNNNGLRDAGEAFSDCPVSLTVQAAPAINVVQTQLDLGWVSRNASKSGQVEIRNTGNVMLNAVYPLRSALVFGANNIPVASITFTTIPAMPFSLDVGQSKIATVTVTIGAVQGAYTYSGIQRIFEDHLTMPGVWDGSEVSDTFELIVSIGSKVIYETNLTNPPLDFGPRNVMGTYNLPITAYSGSNVPLDRVRWRVLTPLTSPDASMPVASLTFTPSVAQAIAGMGSRAYQANVEIGFPRAGDYVATAAFFDDDDDNLSPNGLEASATFQVRVSVNASYGFDILASDIDFGNIDAGASKTAEVGFMNTGNAAINVADLNWAFSDIASLTEPANVIPSGNLTVLSYSYSPVPPGAMATATIRLSVPAGQTKDVYGPSGPQRMTRGAIEDSCTFRVKVGGSDQAMVEKHSLYQEIATLTFTAPVPPATDLYFLSAWVCPGSGSADVAFIQYDFTGKPVATVSLRIDAAGQLTTYSAGAFPIAHSGISDSEPIEIDGDEYRYYRVYLAFNLTFSEAVASSTRLVLHNSSPVADRRVWFDGIKLERAFEGQTRPTTYHPDATLHSPTRQQSLQGGHQYYEW